MNTSGEAADQVVRMSLEVGEAALKISGTGAKHLAVMLYAVLKEKKKTKGRVRLETLVKSGRKVFVPLSLERSIPLWYAIVRFLGEQEIVADFFSDTGRRLYFYDFS